MAQEEATQLLRSLLRWNGEHTFICREGGSQWGGQPITWGGGGENKQNWAA